MKIIKASKKAFRLIKISVAPIFCYIKQGVRTGQMKSHCKSLARHLFRHLNALGASLDKEYKGLGDLHLPSMQKLRQLTAGLHALLPKQPVFSYSIIIPIQENTHLEHLRGCLHSSLQQTAPHMEVIAVHAHKINTDELQKILEECSKAFPGKLKVLSIAEQAPEMINQAVKEAFGHYLLVLDPADWIRPDYLFRCEQYLRLLKNKEQACIYTEEYAINWQGHPVPGGQTLKPNKVIFPYVFDSCLGKSLLIPRELWNTAGGMNFALSDEAIGDLSFRLDMAGAHFCHLPFALYARRGKCPPSSSLLPSLKKYGTLKEIDWEWSEGLIPGTFRALPSLSSLPAVQVIIPFKEQKNLTLSTVKSVLRQKGVQVLITAIDNGSQDRSIAEAIETLGGEVLRVEEPFNFSRLNNFAVQNTLTAKHCPYLLFLNNDVELEENALLEMCRWIEQPHVGLVGCRLVYPNGLLQHGGIDIKRDAPAHQVIWNHSEKMTVDAKQRASLMIRLADAVTAACALMKRELFNEVGGFDEIWYPVAYSDTNLAVKVESRGFHCLYTPYARGVHHESVSRQYENIEDVEMSRWLHDQYLQHHSKF